MKKLIVILIAILVIIEVNPLSAQNPVQKSPEKKALAILGDTWHCVAPLYISIVRKLNSNGYKTDVIIDNNVPFDKLSEYKIVVLSRYATDDLRRFSENVYEKPEGKQYRWITPEQEMAIENYVKAGGHLLLHHDGIGYYPKGGGITKLAKAFHNFHPPMGEITVKPTGKFPELTAGIEPFVVTDEEFKLEDMDESTTTVFMESFSEKNGRALQGWVHEYGKGKVVVFIPGHNKASLDNPMVTKCLANIIDWLDK